MLQASDKPTLGMVRTRGSAFSRGSLREEWDVYRLWLPTKPPRRLEERMNLHGTCQLEFRSSKRRRRGLGLSFYKHFTPDGVGQSQKYLEVTSDVVRS